MGVGRCDRDFDAEQSGGRPLGRAGLGVSSSSKVDVAGFSTTTVGTDVERVHGKPEVGGRGRGDVDHVGPRWDLTVLRPGFIWGRSRGFSTKRCTRQDDRLSAELRSKKSCKRS